MRSTASVERFLEPYRRVTSSGNLIPEIDGLRFLAIFSVFLYHLAGDVLRHSAAGFSETLQDNGIFRVTQILNFGVPLFFAISGFILSLPFASAHLNGAKQVSIKKYFWRRVTRLEPPYILSLILFLFLKLASGKGTFVELWPNFAASLGYVHNAIFGRASDINFVAWSLEVEVQFYILAPILAMVFAIRATNFRRTLLAAMVLGATAVSGWVSHNESLRISLLYYAQYFLAGFVFTEFYLASRGERMRSLRWDLISAVGWPLLLSMLVFGWVGSAWLLPWLVVLLYLAAFHGVGMNRVVSNPWIVTIGGMCYSIYLLHNYIIAGVGAVTERVLGSGGFTARLMIQFLLIAPVALACSALFFRWIERPCMKPDWPQRLKAALFSSDKQPSTYSANTAPRPSI